MAIAAGQQVVDGCHMITCTRLENLDFQVIPIRDVAIQLTACQSL